MSREQGKWYSAQGVGGLKRMQQENIDLSQGIYSCYNGVFKGFCPLYMVCGAAELLATDSKLVYEKAKAAGIEAVVFDRGGYLYHGRVKSLAEEVARDGDAAAYAVSA